MLHTDPAATGDARAAAAWEQALHADAPAEVFEELGEVTSPRVLGRHGLPAADPEPRLTLSVAVAAAAVPEAKAEGVHLLALLHDAVRMADDELERHWTGFLRLHNLYQHLPFATLTTARAARAGGYIHVPVRPKPAGGAGPDGAPASDPAWAEARPLVDPALHALCDWLAAAGWPAPEPGFELADEIGAVVGLAELAWPAHRRAVMTEAQATWRTAFVAAGWHVALAAELDPTPPSWDAFRQD